MRPPRKPNRQTAEAFDVPPGLRRQWIIVSICAFAVCLSVLWWNAAPSVTFHDSGEFAMAAASAGVPHPPGAPTWTILAALFVRLGGFHDPARGTNLFSGLCGAIAMGLLCWVMQLWAWMLFPRRPRWAPSAAGISAVLVMFHSPSFLDQSMSTEQYTLLAALMMSIIAVATAVVLRASASAPTKWLSLLLGLLWGLAIGNHLSQVSLGLLVAWALWAGSSRRFRDFIRLSGVCLAGLALGLLVFLWVPIRSHANPLMDWGNVKTLDRFIWAMLRKEWPSRPLSAAPPNLLPEWLKSYDFTGQLGLVGAALAGIGVLALAGKRRMWLGWLAAIAIPYGAGMLIGYLRQKHIRMEYVCTYGVTDWHLPIYFALAMSASIGFAALISWLWNSRARTAVPLIVIALISPMAITATSAVGRSSLRHYTAPEEFVREIVSPLPADAIIISGHDDPGFMVAYDRYVLRRYSGLYVGVRSIRIRDVMSDADLFGNDPEAVKAEFVRRNVENVNMSYLRVPPPDFVKDRPVRVYSEYYGNLPEEAAYLLPVGYMFEFAGRRTSDAEVRAAERLWRSRFPNLLRTPNPGADQEDRDAHSVPLADRGDFFAARGMWKDSVESYKLSLRWLDCNAVVWFHLGAALDHAGRVLEAMQAYKRSIALIPSYSAPRHNLALIYARPGRREAPD